MGYRYGVRYRPMRLDPMTTTSDCMSVAPSNAWPDIMSVLRGRQPRNLAAGAKRSL